MKTKIFLSLVLPIFLLAIFAGGALGAKDAKKSDKFIPRALPVDGAQPPSGEYTGPSPVFYESGKQPDCEDINPEEPIVILQHDQWGATYYDQQQRGSMGRMIAVSCGGHRHMVFHETRGPFPAFPRYVTYNCKNPVSVWCGPLQMDGGSDINAGDGQMMVMHDGTEVILYDRTQPPIVCWHSTLARGEFGYQCQCYIIKKYDIPDEHNNPSPGDTEGYWPKGYVMYDAIADTHYIHIVTTQSTGGTGDRTIAYQRCYFEGNNLICVSPGYGPYNMIPGTYYGARDIAVFDEITTISAVFTGSPVSRRVAIVYTKNRDETQENNDVVYIESMNNGDDWLDGTQWPPVINNITNYLPAWPERAYTDVAACYDYNDSLHIVWNAHRYNPVTGQSSSDSANLYHWCKEHGITMIAYGYWAGTNPGAWNRNICKMSISAKDPIYHPGHEPDEPDSVFLFVTWTQFNPGDMSLGGFTNGDIYAAGSKDAGKFWGPGFNLTNTQTPDCAPDECLSEHWSSMAENMYDGDLHIEYVCDRDAGAEAEVPPEGVATDNPMMYMHVEQFPIIDACGASYELIDPTDWCTPPLKVLPGEFRIVTLELTGLYNIPGDYEVTTDHEPEVTCVANCNGTLEPGDKVEVGVIVECPPGEEGFIAATVLIRVCIGTDDEKTFEVALHAVCSDTDYYECPVDPRTWILKDNCKCSLWVCCNTEQRVWDKRLRICGGDDAIQPIFSAGSLVGTTWEGDTIVCRQDYRDIRTGTRDTMEVVESSVPHPDEEPECKIQMIYCKNTFCCANHLEPPNHLRWWWIDIHKKIIMFHDRDPYECPNWKKEQVIKKIWITKSEPPVWWPEAGVGAQAYEKIKLGYFADVDAPFCCDSNGYNQVGYDYDRHIMWQSGYDGLCGHPEYLDYYVGLALTDHNGAVVAPWAAHNVLNEDYLYPQQGWGWNDEELYRLMDIPGVSIANPGVFEDRTWVITTDIIPAGTAPFHSDFILIEAFIPGDEGTGLAQLQQHIDDTRATLIPELRDLGVFFQDPDDPPHKIFPICGDVNEDGNVNVADAVYLVTYLFQNGPPPSWPMNRADVTNNGVVDVADLVYLVTYLFQNGPAPDCSGFGR